MNSLVHEIIDPTYWEKERVGVGVGAIGALMNAHLCFEKFYADA